MKNWIKPLIVALCMVSAMAGAQPDKPEVETNTKFAVIMPERIDRDWYWVLYSDETQHIVQSEVERALIRTGVDVIDLSTAELPTFSGNWSSLASRNFATQLGGLLDVDYIVSGYATAVKGSETTAYGINTVRTQVDITAKIIRVSDGKILEIFDESLLSGGQSVEAAAKSALREAGGKISRDVGRYVKNMTTEQSEP